MVVMILLSLYFTLYLSLFMDKLEQLMVSRVITASLKIVAGLKKHEKTFVIIFYT